jgi:hypothetical protein
MLRYVLNRKLPSPPVRRQWVASAHMCAPVREGPHVAREDCEGYSVGDEDPGLPWPRPAWLLFAILGAIPRWVRIISREYELR